MIYITAFILSLLLIFLLSKISYKINLLDLPNDERKIHNIPTPTVGGISIVLTVFFFLPYYNYSNGILIILFSSLILLIVGLLDDIFQIDISVRFISQIIGCLIIVGSGLKIIDIGSYSFFQPFELGIFGIFLTVFSVLCLTNAINFIDGLDGLSSGILIISLFSLIFFIYFERGSFDNNLLFILIISLSAFFIVNVGLTPFKKIFLGDSGSTTLGFIIGWVLIYYTHPDNRLMHPILAVWCITLPMFELLAIILRRLKLKKNPFQPDKRHIHHLLLKLNISKINTLNILLILSFILNMSGFIIYKYVGPGPSWLMYIVFFVLYYYITNYIFNKINK